MNEKKSLILMVEDEEQVLNTNCRMLRRRGYDVRTAQTVSEVYHQLEEQLPDLLILDIMLPDGNGLDICRHFREKTMNPVLFLTGKSDISDKVEGLQQGGDYYLTKPDIFLLFFLQFFSGDPEASGSRPEIRQNYKAW